MVPGDGASLVGTGVLPSDLTPYYGSLTGLNGDNGGLGDYGISDTSFDPIGFPVHPPGDPAQPTWGIVNSSTTASDFTGSMDPQVSNSVIISWGLESGGVIDQVNFLYGTDYIPAVPEPATILLLGSGLIGLAGFPRRRLLKK